MFLSLHAYMAADLIEKYNDRVKALGLGYDLDYCKGWSDSGNTPEELFGMKLNEE